MGNRNHITQLCDPTTGKVLHSLDRRMTQEIAFSPDSRFLAAGYVDGHVGIWDVAKGESLIVKDSGCKEVYSVAWNSKGDLLATAGRDGKVILWEPKTMKKLRELDVGFWVIQVRFNFDGTRIYTSSASDHTANSDRKIGVWSIPEKK